MSAPSNNNNNAVGPYIVDVVNRQKPALDEIWKITDSEGPIDTDALSLLKGKCKAAVAGFVQEAEALEKWLSENPRKDPATDPVYTARRSALHPLRRMKASLGLLFDECETQLDKRYDDCEKHIREQVAFAKESVLRGTDQECEPQGGPATSAPTSRSSSEEVDPALDTVDTKTIGGSTANGLPPATD